MSSFNCGPLAKRHVGLKTQELFKYFYLWKLYDCYISIFMQLKYIFVLELPGVQPKCSFPMKSRKRLAGDVHPAPCAGHDHDVAEPDTERQHP